MDDITVRIKLEGAEQIQAGTAKAADGLQRFGVAGAKAGQQVELSGYQMAQVSAQLQDLFIQIQGGQAPLTALLQQSSQLSAVFGGFGNAARAVATVVTPAVAVLGTLAAAAVALSIAYDQGAEEAKAYGRSLVLTGNAADVTVGKLQAMAAAQADVVGTQGAAAEALAALAATGKVSAASLGAAAEAATRLARAGIPLEETVKKFAALGKDPLKALVQLNEAENFLTESVYRQVKALEQQGRKAEAASVAQEEYARVGVERAKELEKQLGSIERAWANVGFAAKGAWDFLLNIGRSSTAQTALERVERQIRESEERIAKARSGETSRDRPFLNAERIAAGQERVLAGLREEASALQEVIRLESRSASAQAERASAMKATIKADEDAADAAKKAATARDQENAAMERAVGLSGSYQKDLTQLAALREKGRLSEEQYVSAVRQLIAVQPVVREQMEAEAKAQREAAKVRDEFVKSEERRLEALQRSGDQVAEQVLKLQTEEEAVALVKTSNITLAEAIERVTVARLREQQVIAAQDGRQEEVDALQREIEARERLASLAANKEYRDGAKRSAEEAAREWQRTSSQIEQSLTDALLRGFESGKDFAQNLRDTLKNMFNTLVLRPILQPIVGQMSSGISGFFGLSSTASAAGSAGSGNSLFSSLGSLGSLGSASSLASIFGMGAQLTGWSGAGTGVALQGAGSMMANGSILQGAAQGAGALAPWAAGAAAGIYGGRAISGGYGTFGGSGNTAVNVGTAIGAIWGPIGAAIGGAIGGLVNRAFGTKMVYGDAGITGSFSAGDVTAQNFQDWIKKGGWFRSSSSGTNYSALTDEQSTLLGQGAQAVYEQTKVWADALSLPAEELAKVTSSFRLKLTDNAEDNQAAIAELFTTYQEQLSAQFSAVLTPFTKAGETLAQTFSRLATLQTFSGSLNQLGGIFSRIANASVDAREGLIALAGGMDALAQQAQDFVQNYYSREEIASLKAAELQTALQQAGITALPNSREEFRALVEGLNPDTTTGREQLALLLQLQGGFATVADYLSETGQTLSEVAAQAPASDLLTPLLSTTSQQLLLAQQSMSALYDINDSTRMVVDAVDRLIDVVESSNSAGAGRVSGYRLPEVVAAN